MLDQHQARTAIAEGHHREGRETAAPQREKHGPSERALERRDDSAGGTQVHGHEAKPETADDAAPVDTTTGTSTDAGDTPAGDDSSPVVVVDPVAEPVPASPLIALMGALNPTVTGADAPVATAASAAGAQATASGTSVVAQAATASAAATAETAAGSAAAAETAVAAGEGTPAEIASSEVPDVAKPATGDVKTQDAPRAAAKPVAQAADGNPAGYKQPGTGSESAATPARPATPATGERPAVPAVPSPNAQQQPGGQPAAAAAANSPQHASAVTRGDAPLTSGVPLSRAAETVEHVLRLAATRGAMQARVSLKPAELGSLEVVIRQTAGGLTARVVADDAGAAQVLQQAGSELRRSLEQQGITLLNLDIGQSGGERTLGRSSDGAREGGYDGRGGAQTRSGGTVAAEDDISTETTVRLPNGALVDVLA